MHKTIRRLISKPVLTAVGTAISLILAAIFSEGCTVSLEKFSGSINYQNSIQEDNK